MRRLWIVLALTIPLAGWSCGTTRTVEETVVQARSVTVDAVILTDSAARLAARIFDVNCPRSTIFTVDQCRGWREFSGGKTPADAICKLPKFENAPAVLDKCGFHVAFPLVIRAYQEGKESLASIAVTVDQLIKGANAQAVLAGKQ